MERIARWRRSPSVVLEQVDDDLFLVEPASQSIYHLNPVAAGVWRLLAAPIAETEIVAVLGAAFPEAGAPVLAADVAGLLSDLAARGLVTRVD